MSEGKTRETKKDYTRGTRIFFLDQILSKEWSIKTLVKVL
jgi:hypothetical protein